MPQLDAVLIFYQSAYLIFFYICFYFLFFRSRIFPYFFVNFKINYYTILKLIKTSKLLLIYYCHLLFGLKIYRLYGLTHINNLLVKYYIYSFIKNYNFL